MISFVRVTSAQARAEPITLPSYITGSLRCSRSRNRRRYSGTDSSTSGSGPGSTSAPARRARWRLRDAGASARSVLGRDEARDWSSMVIPRTSAVDREELLVDHAVVVEHRPPHLGLGP